MAGGAQNQSSTMKYCSLLVAAFVTLISLGFAVWYAHCSMDVTDESGEFMVRNYFINVYFCLLLAFLAFQNFAIQMQDPMERHGRFYLVMNNGYFVTLAILCLEMAASWDVYGRGDLAAWSACSIVASILNIYSLSSRNQGKQPRRSRVIEPTSEKSSLIDPVDPEAVNPRVKWTGGRKGRREAEYVYQKSGTMQCCSTLNGIAKLMVLGVTVLMFLSAIVHGMGTQSFPPTEDGGFIQIDRNTRVYFKCQGVKQNVTARFGNDSSVVLLSGNSDLGIGDFLGLTDLMEEKGLRYCVWDRPGVGFSDFAKPRSFVHPQNDLVNFLKALHERENATFVGPFFLVGFERGGRDAMFAAEELGPEIVSNVLIADTVMPDFKRRALVEVGNFTEQQATKLVLEQIQERIDFTSFMNRVSIPLGMAGLFEEWESTGDWKRVSAKEQRWYDTTAKTWVARWAKAVADHQRIRNDHISADPQTKRPYKTSVPVDVMISTKLDERLVKCDPEKQEQMDDECKLNLALLHKAEEEKRSMVDNGGEIFECNDCGRKSFMYDRPDFTVHIVETILERMNV